MNNAITVTDLTKVYKLYEKPFDRVKETFSRNKVYSREFFALNHISFSIPKGTTVGFVGRNGAGKSTLLKLLTGVLKTTTGRVEVSGNVSALLELGAGFNMDFTGRENIYLNATVMRIPKAEIEAKMEAILQFADIGTFIDQPVKTYSSGMFVRLAFAVAIHVNPDILIVDEALAVGDTRFQLKCMEKFMQFQKEGKTVLFVSHDIHMIKRFCERVIWLNEGQVVMDGETDQVTDMYHDFLKSGLSLEDFWAEIEDRGPVLLEDEISQIDIAELRTLTMKNADGQIIEDITHGEEVHLEIEYVVNDAGIEEPVLGVAIRRADHTYICGLNTRLDGLKLPWKRGRNRIELVYDAFNLVGGNYYFDVAIMDHTATVNIDYKTKMKSFFVKMGYIAEGVVVLSHRWQRTDREL